ncbi:DUF6160 family protein [Acinetobacter guerrae]|uniref:putative pilus system protein FilA n=1 Tax=Acinetobacter guerrae TaxID=1843371 RepID=UPI00128B5199|nr:DUF6160 family protein [Acinetobacter guerrae]MPW44125.1 pilus assembly protein FilA [Acinetobacter guerrae]
MKMFTKLALVSSIAISANAMAMQSMDDAALSSTTGQDGLNIGIGISKITIDKLAIHDNDGLAQVGNPATTNPDAPASANYNGGTSTAGAIVIKGNAISGDVNETSGLVITAPIKNGALDTTRALASHNMADLVIDTDAGGANGAFLNVAAAVSGLDIYIGEVGVAKSKAYTVGAVKRGVEDTGYNKILNGLTLKTGKMDANIQLGTAPQGAMIKLNTTMQGGLELANLSIHDGSGNGDIVLDSIKVASTGSTTGDLNVDASVKVLTTGLQITSNDAAGNDIYIKGIHLGTKTATNSIGDVEVSGLKTFYGATMSTPGSQITISGH